MLSGQPHLCALRVRVPRPAGQWWRSHGNEHWEFDEETGLMRRRDASINDYRIEASERRIATD